MTLSHKTCFNTSGQGFKKDYSLSMLSLLKTLKRLYSLSMLSLLKTLKRLYSLSMLSLLKIALIANRVFFKIMPRSVKTSFMNKGHGQGVLKRKNY